MNGDIAILDILRSNPTVGALIGGTGAANARVFISEAPQKAIMPFIVCDVYDSEPFDSKSGTSVVDHELVKVFCYAEKSSEAITLSDAVRAAVDGANGTYNSEVVEYIRWLRYDGYNVELVNRKAYVREHDYQVRIRV